jgi:hypothetical protein
MTGRFVAGLALVALGVVFLLGELGVLAAPGAVVGAWWPVVFLALGVGLALEQRRLGIGPLVFLALGLVLLSLTTDLVALDARIVWPVVVIAVGLWLILRPAGRQRPGPEHDAPHLNLTAVFDDRKLRSSADDFRGAALTSIFGDVDLDLRDAAPGADMTVDVTSIYGEIDVTAPSDWQVELSASGLFSDIEHRPPPQPAPRDAPTLTVRGFSLFGDVTVRQ